MTIIYKFAAIFTSIFLMFIQGVFAQQSNEWVNLTTGFDVTCIAEEDDFVWLGTTGGLARIDKFSHEIFFINKANSGLPDININDILIDQNNGKWIATQRGGVAYYDNQSWTVFNTFNSNLNTNMIEDLHIDNSNNLWILTSSKIFKYNQSTIESFNLVANDVDFNIFKKLAFDSNGYMWIASQSHVFKIISPTEIEKYNPSFFGLTYMYIFDFKIDDNVLWIATSGDGVIRLEDSICQHFNTGNSQLPSDYIKSIDIIGNDLLFSTSKGLAIFDNQSWVVYNDSNTSMQSNKISCAIKDEFNNMWLGTFGDGLLKLSGNVSLQINTSNSILKHSHIYNMVIDKNGDKWFATLHGLARLEGNNLWTLYTKDDSPLPDNRVWDIAIDDDNIKWLATENGLVKFDGVNWHIYNSSNSALPSNYISKLHVSENGDLWIGVYNNGLVKFDGQNWTHYNTSNSALQSDSISAIYSTNGEVWVGTYFLGMAKFKNFTWSVYNTSNSNLHSNFIMSINKDFNGNLIVGTLFGTTVFNNGNFSLLDTSDVMINCAGVYSVDFDKDSSLLMCTGNGLFIYKDTLVKHYHFFNAPITSFNVSRALRDEHNNLWLPTICGGIVVYNENGVVLNTSKHSDTYKVENETFLYQNYPNPFVSSTTIAFDLPEAAYVHLQVFNANGKMVAQPIANSLAKGFHSIQFSSNNMPNGVYFYSLKTKNYSLSKRMVLMK